MMNRTERIRIAEEIATKLREAYSDRILLIQVGGSLARRDDHAHSDLDLRVITSERIRTTHMSDDGYVEFVLKDTPILLEFRTKEEALKTIRKVGYHWPIQVWDLLEGVPVGHGETYNEVLSELRQALDALKPDDFAEAVDWALRWVWEALRKLRGATEEGSICRATQAAHFLAYSAAMLVALLNRRYYRHSDCRWLETAKQFEHLPLGFFDLSRSLLTGTEPIELLRAGESLWRNCEILARQLGYDLRGFRSLEHVFDWMKLPLSRTPTNDMEAGKPV